MYGVHVIDMHRLNRTLAREGALLVVVLVVSLAEWASAENHPLRLDPPALLVVIPVAALVLRRKHPVPSLITVAIGQVMVLIAGGPIVAAPLVVLVSSVAVHDRVVVAAAGGAGGFAVALLVSALIDRPPSDNITAPVALAFALTLGWSVRSRHRYRAAMIDKAERDVQLAASEERARIARELHDVTAHSLSVMVRLADGAAAATFADPPQSQAAMRNVARIGRDSLTDMRGLLGAIGETEHAPQPQLADLAELVETYRLAGLPVSLRLPEHHDIGEGMQLLMYRTVQESLTNALRYADHPAMVEVRISDDPSGFIVEVSDDGRGSRSVDLTGSNRGISGLRERAAMYGGTVTAGSRDDAPGWIVRVQLPVMRGLTI